MNASLKNIFSSQFWTNRQINGAYDIVRKRGQKNKDEGRVITHLVQSFKDRSQKNLDQYRLAVAAAENIIMPRRRLLLSIYDNIETDNHLTSIMETRTLKVLCSKFKIIDSKTKEEVEEKTKLLKKSWFYMYLKYLMDTRYYGYSCIQFSLPASGQFKEVELVPREHVAPNTSEILRDISDTKGWNFTRPPLSNWIIGAGLKNNLGLLMKAAPTVIFKRNAQLAWAEYSEIFGMPIRTATTQTRDAKEIQRVADMLEQMGRAAQAVFPEGTSITLHESKTNDAYLVYDKQIERCNSELSKLIFGQTGTADEKAHVGASKVHDQVSDDYTDDDLTMCELHINDILIPFLISHGYPLADCEFTWDDHKELSPLEKAKIGESIRRMGYKPKKDFLEKTFGFELEEAEQGEDSGNVFSEINALYCDV